MTEETNDLDQGGEPSDTERTQPYIVVHIHKDAVENLPVVVFPHEVPILALVHGENKIAPAEDADLPNGVTEGKFEVEDEFVRLEQRYGNHKGTGQSHASMVFGDAYGLAEALDRFDAGEAAPRTRPTARTKAATAAKAKAARTKAS